LTLPCDLLILDEACAAWQLDMVDRALLRQAVCQRPKHREVVLTGRTPADWMLEAADYCTEMRAHRHPYEHGIAARRGVEY
jgi:cob(I)alamin adenosyltransferase